MDEHQRRAYERPLASDGAPDAESGYYRHREGRRGVDVTGTSLFMKCASPSCIKDEEWSEA